MREHQAIPLADLRSLADPVRRTTVIRLGLAAALVLTLLAAAWAARLPGASAVPVVEGGDSGVIVLDLSASIGDPKRPLRAPFQYLADTGQKFGLVLFSNIAYEAIPPGTASSELPGFLRALTPPIQTVCVIGQSARCSPEMRRVRPGSRELREIQRRSVIPWSQTFRAGTEISTGLTLGRQVLAREGQLRRGVLLISDLANALSDMRDLIAEIGRYKQEGVPLYVVALNAHPSDRAIYEQLLGREAFVDHADLAAGLAERQRRAAAGVPEGLAGLALLLLMLLAANEHFCGRLAWRKVRNSEGTP